MPFADYESFDVCVEANKDKDDPEAYCGAIKNQVEGVMLNPDFVKRVQGSLKVAVKAGKGASKSSGLDTSVREMTVDALITELDNRLFQLRGSSISALLRGRIETRVADIKNELQSRGVTAANSVEWTQTEYSYEAEYNGVLLLIEEEEGLGWGAWAYTGSYANPIETELGFFDSAEAAKKFAVEWVEQIIQSEIEWEQRNLAKKAMEFDQQFIANPQTSMSFPDMKETSEWDDEFAVPFTESENKSEEEGITSESAIQVRPKAYRGSEGFLVSGTNQHRPNGVSIFVYTKEQAENVRSLLNAGDDDGLDKYLLGLSEKTSANEHKINVFSGPNGTYLSYEIGYSDSLVASLYDWDGSSDFNLPDRWGFWHIVPGSKIRQVVDAKGLWNEAKGRVVWPPYDKATQASKGGILTAYFKTAQGWYWSVANIHGESREGKAHTPKQMDAQMKQAIKEFAKISYSNMKPYLGRKAAKKAANMYPGIFSAKEDHVRELMEEYNMSRDEASNEAEYQYSVDPSKADNWNVNMTASTANSVTFGNTTSVVTEYPSNAGWSYTLRERIKSAWKG